MNEAEQLSALIGEIYDSALDRSLWTTTLEHTCDYIQGQSGGLVAQGPMQSKVQLFFEWGTAPEYIESYQHTYGPA